MALDLNAVIAGEGTKCPDCKIRQLHSFEEIDGSIVISCACGLSETIGADDEFLLKAREIINQHYQQVVN